VLNKVGDKSGELVICDPQSAQRIAAMLDLDPAAAATRDTVPRGWHFPFFGSHVPRSQLRSDGFPGLGIAMPDLGLPRLLLGGRTVEYRQDIALGARLWRSSEIKKLDERDGKAGRFAIITIGLQLGPVGSDIAAIAEEQTFFLFGASWSGSSAPSDQSPLCRDFEFSRSLMPDDTLLFQFSALAFNSHKIHLDRAHARSEGFPDLVVNGGLTTLFLTEFARTDLAVEIGRLKVKFFRPLFSGHPLTIGGERQDGGWKLAVLDADGRLAAEAEISV
jgi:3-methylfumaryl-CoA hydratase